MEKQNIQRRIRKLFFICSFNFLLLFVVKGNAQNYSSGFTVKMDGYVVNVGGKILFQPCEDSTKNIWASLDNRSFPLWYFREDLYLEAIDNIGDSVKIYCYDVEDKKKYYMNLSYFYCSLEVDMMFLDSARFKIFKEPKYEITFNDKTYHIYGFNVDNRIKKIIPRDVRHLRLMYDYYWSKGYSVPKWLDKLVRCKNK